MKDASPRPILRGNQANGHAGIEPAAPYPPGASSRARWIVGRRGPKNLVDPTRAYAALWEEEPGADDGGLVSTATVFLTNRECPYRCLMCDLWRNTTDERVPLGSIPAQIRQALTELPPARQIKLYNAGSFFDSQAVPPEDYPAIADLARGYDRVIVECHPALVGKPCLEFRKALLERRSQGSGILTPDPGGTGSMGPRLEVAIGLETVHEGVLAALNKRFTLDDFRRAAAFLADHQIDLRVFLLVRPPFLTEAEGVDWAKRSLDFAFDRGASVCCVIPTRGGNGAMETLAASGDWSPPSIKSLEAVHEYGLRLARGRVFADLWDIERFYDCDCSPSRQARMAEMNRSQIVVDAVECGRC